MANKPKKIEYEDPVMTLIKKADKLERDAENLKRGIKTREEEKLTPLEITERIGMAYLDAGADRFNAGDYSGADEDYSKAEMIFYYDKEIKRTISEYRDALHEAQTYNRFRKGKGKNLARKFAIISIATLVLSLFFVTSNLTGNVIAGLDANNSRIIGICLFACGLIFAFVFLRSKNKVKSKVKSKAKRKSRK